ncbi:MAG: polymerase sigma-70 factor, subfamily [Parcubacteria group bacterium]|nr:polymerase sigma-70 factor, subfamily [Parcubacteria group bacterium]
MKELSHDVNFTRIYETEHDAIYRFCLMRTSDAEIAHDFTQDVFTRFWKAMTEEQDIKSPRSFLFTIARNLIIDWYRKKKSLSLDALLEEAGDDKSFVGGTPMDTVEISAEVSHVMRHLDQLEEPYRKAVYMRHVEGLKPREIAAYLNESANVISVRITRGVERLGNLMGYK